MTKRETFYDRQIRRVDLKEQLHRLIPDEGTYEPGLVFVGMPLGRAETERVWKVIDEECTRLNLIARRVDQIPGSGFVIRDIVDLIERAQYLIFDLSGERPNVYYELGYAHRIGNEDSEISLIAERGTRLHFDVAQLRVNFYGGEDEARDKIRAELRRMISADGRVKTAKMQAAARVDEIGRILNEIASGFVSVQSLARLNSAIAEATSLTGSVRPMEPQQMPEGFRSTHVRLRGERVPDVAP